MPPCRTVEPHQPANGSHQGRHEKTSISHRALPRAIQHPRHALEDVRCARGSHQREGGRGQPLYLGHDVSVHGRDVTDEAFRRISGGEAREISLSMPTGIPTPSRTPGASAPSCAGSTGICLRPATAVCEFPDTCGTKRSGAARPQGYHGRRQEGKARCRQGEREAYGQGRRAHSDRALAGGDLRHHGRHVDRRRTL